MRRKIIIKKVAGLIICLGLAQAAVAVEPGQFSFEGSRITGQSTDRRTTVRSIVPDDRALFEQGIIAGRTALPVEQQSIFPSGTFNFQINAANSRINADIKYHAVVSSSPEGDVLNSVIAGIGAMPRHGYDLGLYPEIVDSLNTLGVTGNDKPGIVNFAAFVHPEANPEALLKNTMTIANLIHRLAADGERLPEERSQESAEVKTRAVPEYVAAFFHPDHPIVAVLKELGFTRLKDSGGGDSHMLDTYIDGPVDAALKVLKESKTAEALEALKVSEETQKTVPQITAEDLRGFFASEAALTLPWRTTFILPLTAEAEANLRGFSKNLASRPEHTSGVSDVAVNVALRKLKIPQ